METHESVHPDAATAAASLSSLQSTRADIADRIVTPWWYHPALGLLIGGVMASMSTHSTWVGLVALVVFFAGIYALKKSYERLTGLWVNGLRPGRTRSAIHVWFVVYYVVFALSLWLEYGRDVRGAMAVGGLVIGVAMVFIGRWWDRLLRAELRGEQ